MKIFNKGQVVIPAKLRKGLGVEPGDFMDVTLDLKMNKIELRPHRPSPESSVAGSLADYARNMPFPTRSQMTAELRKGLLRDS